MSTSTNPVSVLAVPHSAGGFSPSRRFLHGPLLDATLLWGASFLVLPLLLLIDVEANVEWLFGTTMLVAHFVNHPHFAHSYQIFYRSFLTRLTSSDRPLSLRIRYGLVGIGAPLGFTIGFGLAILHARTDFLALAVNAMFLLVGWHYVKQGFGILMTDAALKKIVISSLERKTLLFNAHAVWVLTWCNANDELHAKEYFGIQYFTFDVPDLLKGALVAVATLSTIATGVVLIRKSVHARSNQIPWNGVMAYGVSTYVWTLMAKVNPLWTLVIPALHSLQYLAVVWRYEVNASHASTRQGDRFTAKARFMTFVGAGILMGYIGFWMLPEALNHWVQYPTEVFGGSLFLFCAWVAINIHHYFIDSVIWRKGNPDTRRFLFGN